MSLTTKQKRFVAEYLKDSNATQAAIRAGYSGKTAGSQGHDLLKKPEIAAAVAGKTEAVALKGEDILKKLAALANDAERDSDKIAALHLLGKNLKLFTDKTEVSGKDGVPIAVSINGIRRE